MPFSVQFIERKDRVRPGFEYIKTSIGGKPVSLNGHVSRPNKHVYLGYTRAVTNSFTDAITVIHHTTSKRDDSVSYSHSLWYNLYSAIFDYKH